MLHREENAIIEVPDNNWDNPPTHARWEAWIDGQRDAGVYFVAPTDGAFDIVAAAADALGVDVDSFINVELVKYLEDAQ